MIQRNSFTFKLDEPQQQALVQHLATGNYRPLEVAHTRAAAQGRDCTIALYTSGKCLVQGKGAQEWVTFVLEPTILQEVGVGYENLLHPERSTPHMGVDESGKGDFFGPMVIAAAYVDEKVAAAFDQLNVRDSKRITTDKKAHEMARSIREVLEGRFALVTIGPRAYNRLYGKMRNVNKILAWGHARAIEDLLQRVPDCPRAVSDQFGPTRQIEQALMKHGRDIKLEQRPKAETDPAVAAASILARDAFVRALRALEKKYDLTIPKGASDAVLEAAATLAEREGAEVLLDTVKCHFKSTDKVLARVGTDRATLGPDGEAVSRSFDRGPRRT